MEEVMTPAELLAVLIRAQFAGRPARLVGGALDLAIRLAWDEVEREADVEALAEQTLGGAREEDDCGW